MKINTITTPKDPSGKTRGIFCFRNLLVLLISCSFFSIYAQAKMEIKDAKQNFGFVKKGEVIRLEYEITNAGTEPLIITDAEVICSCTTVDFPKQPINPKQTVKVIVNFDTKTVYDRQDRVVLLKSNDPKSPSKIRYKGFVLKK